MEIKKIYDKIMKDETKEKECHLAHVFIMPESNFDIKKDNLDETGTEIHIGFYNKETKKIFSYKLFNEEIESIPEQDLFQKEEKEVMEISLDKLAIDVKEILQIVRDLVNKNFPETVSLKIMIVLQNIISYGFIWNVTILRRDFKTINIKVDAVSGKIKHQSCDSLIDLEKSTRKN